MFINCRARLRLISCIFLITLYTFIKRINQTNDNFEIKNIKNLSLKIKKIRDKKVNLR